MSANSIAWARVQILQGALLLAVGCLRVPAHEGGPAAPAERWVDAYAREGGDGSRERAYRSLGQALAEGPRPLHVHLAAGLYQGPFELEGGVSLEGRGRVVLHAEGGEAAVVRVRGPASLKGLAVQGGAVGVEVAGGPDGELRLVEVELSAQRRVAVWARGGRVVAQGSVFRAAVSEVGGLVLEGGRGELSGVSFLGPFRRAVEVKQAQVALEDCRFAGPVTGLHQVGGSAVVRRSTFEGGRGPALFASQGGLEVEEGSVKGHEYALQTGEGAHLRVRKLVSVGAERAALALVGTRADVEDVLLLDSGSYGGLEVVGGDVVVRRFWIDRPDAYGVLGRGGRLRLEHGVVSRVTDRGGDAGDGVQLRKVTAHVESVWVVEVAGFGLHAAEASVLVVQDAVLDRCAQGGVAAESLARVEGTSLLVSRSPSAAVVVPDEASVRLDTLASEQNALGVVWAECARGAQVELRRVRTDGPAPPSSPCVRQVGPPVPPY